MSIYTEEHRIFQDSIRRFIAKEITPHVDRWEADCHFPSEIFPKLGEQGFLGILIPEEWDGVDKDYIFAAAWCEEFGRVPSVGFTVAVNMHSVVVSTALARYGSEEAKGKWLRAAVAGEAIGAYAFTEPGAGSDLTQVQTRAVPDGDDFLVSGSKIFITNGARADFVLVLAKTDTKKGYGGYTTFVVDTSLEGFEVSRTLSKLGWHSSDTAELTLTNVRVPKSMVLGELNKGWYQAMSSLEWERLMLTLGAIGGAQQCLEDTVRYVNERKIFGKKIAEFDRNQFVLTSLWSRLLAGTAQTHRGVELLQAGKRCRKEVSLAKANVCELAIEIADACLQLHGGYGYTTEFRPERWLRDLRLNTIGGGATEVMRRVALGEFSRSL